MIKVMVSGGFDPLHKGHVRMIKEASKYGDVIVALNSDDWLKRKKGFVYMPWEDRAEILSSLKWVDRVIPVDDADGTVCDAIERIKPDFFANGGDRFPDNVPEAKLCKQLNVSMLFNVGGGKAESSSEIVNRSWGFYRVLHDDQFKVKILTVLPGKATSMQRHKHRNEHWITPADNRYQFVPVGEWHKLENNGDEPVHVVEIQTGSYFGEDDIERCDTDS